MPLPCPRPFHCRTGAAVLGAVLALLLLPGLAWAEPSFVTAYQSFTDVNNNGLLDCGEPVHILVGVLTNDDSPALSGRITMPAAGTLGLFYETGTAQVDHYPIPTIGCTGQVVRGNDSGDTLAEVTFECPADTPGDNQSYALVLSYDATYLNQTSSTFTATAHFALDGGPSFDRSDFESFPASSCSGGSTELTVTKTASGPATPGSVLLYSITATNTTSLDQGGIQLTDVVPDHTTFDLAASSPGWSCPTPDPGALCRLPVGTIPAGESVTRFFAVRIDATVPAPPVDLANTSCARNGPTLVLGCGSTSTPVDGMPLLALSKTLTSGTGTPGATLVYRLAVANTGNQDAGPVTVTETVPANTTYAPGGSSPGWTCTPNGAAGSTCTLLLPGVAAGAIAAADFAVTVAATLPAGTSQIANTACASSASAPEDCSTQTTPTAGHPALALTKSVAGTGSPGGLLTYSLHLRNDGDQGAAGVTLSETVPLLTSFVAASSSPGWVCSPSIAAGSVCTLPVGTLPAGADATYTFVVRVIDPLPVQASRIDNSACARAPGLPDACDGTSVPTVGSPEILLAKTYGGGPVLPSAVLDFTLTVRNVGNQDAGPVLLTETVPALTTFEAAASTPGWSCSPDGNAGSSCALTLPSLAAGASAAVHFAVRAASSLPPAAQIGNAACAQVQPSGAEGCGSVETPPALSVATLLSVALQDDADHSGTVTAGDVLRYTLSVPNEQSSPLLSLVSQPDLDPNTTLVTGSVTTDRGSVTSGNGVGDPFATVSIPSLAPGDVATITFDARIASPLPEGLKRVQAQAFTRGDNFPRDASDDPSTLAPDDPTAIDVAAGEAPPPTPHDIPSLSEYGMIALVLLLAGGACYHLRAGGL